MTCFIWVTYILSIYMYLFQTNDGHVPDVPILVENHFLILRPENGVTYEPVMGRRW